MAILTVSNLKYLAQTMVGRMCPHNSLEQVTYLVYIFGPITSLVAAAKANKCDCCHVTSHFKTHFFFHSFLPSHA